jgi:general secretion pathway protein L
MAHFVGIDISPSYVRAALLRTGYRTSVVERLLEVERSRVETLEQALQTSCLPLLENVQGMAVAVDGEESFIHRIQLPVSARKQLAEVLPFELEAQVPVDFDTLVYDYRELPREVGSSELSVLAVASSQQMVADRIRLIQSALGRAPERVGCGPLPLANLANLAPELSGRDPIALVDVGETRTDAALLVGGRLMGARTLAHGMVGLPESAPLLAAELRQTFAAWAAAGGDPVTRVWLLGLGAQDLHAPAYLSHTTGVPVQSIVEVPGLAAVAGDHLPTLPRFAKAIALAAGLKKPTDPDLRQGGLTYQRSLEAFKERAPLLLGLAGAVLVSFLFAMWAQFRSLSREQEVLETALAAVSEDVLGEETTDPERALDLLEHGDGRDLSDPMPHADAFDVMVGISEAIPMTITHDIEEFDVQRGKVTIRGIVSTAADAEKVASGIKKQVRCAQNVKTGKITQVVNSNRQKYLLEFDLRCPEDGSKAKGKKAKSQQPSTGEGS